MSASLRSWLFIAASTAALALTGCTEEAPDEPEPAADESAATDESPDPEQGPEEPSEEEAAAPTLVPTGGTGLEREVGNITLADVLGDDDGWVTVGSFSEPGDRPTAVFAHSDDGVDWDLDDLPAPAGSEHRASKVVRVDGTTVVIGATRVGPDSHLVLWVGEPGSWELRELQEETGSARALGINGAVTTDDGRVLVVGSTRDEDGTRTPHIWRIDLEGPVEHDAPFDGPGLVRDVTIADGAILAVGEAGDDEAFPPPIVLRSDDGGATWDELGIDGLADASLVSIQGIGERLFIGGLVDGAGTGQAEVWASTDGSSWEPLLNDDNRGTSHVNRVHRLHDRLVGLGTWLEQTDPGSDRFQYFHWPGAGEIGSFGTSAQHDGRIVAVGSREGFPTGLMTTTDLHAWQDIDLPARILENATGVAGWWVRDIAASADEIMLVGMETRLTTRQVDERMFAGLYPTFESPVSGIEAGAASFSSVVFHADHGWVAVGYDRPEGTWWDGPRAATSDDGEQWTEVAVDAGTADRILGVLETDERLLAIGLGWVDGQPEGTIWELDEEDGFVPMETDGLGDWVALSGCASGEDVLLQVYQGGATRAMAVSTDGGHSFEVVDDGPLSTGQGFTCGIDDQGRALIVVYRTGDNEVHRYDLASGDWTELPGATEGSRVSVTRTTWIPGLGWLALGSRVEVEDDEPLVRWSADLEGWQDLAFEGDPSHASASLAAATDGDLFVFGWVDSEPEVWSLPRADLE